MQSSQGLENEIVAALRRIMRAVELHSRELVDEHGLTGPQLAVMKAIARLETASVTAIARAVFLGRPTVTRVLTRLERRGLVERTRSPHDRRSVIVKVTHRGYEILEHAPSLLQERFRDELARLEDWERTTILSTLQRIATMMDAESIPASPVLASGPLTGADEEVENFGATQKFRAGGMEEEQDVDQ